MPPQAGAGPFCGGQGARAPFQSELKNRREASRQLREFGGRAGAYAGAAVELVRVVLEGSVRIVLASAELGGWAASRGLALGVSTYRALAAEPNRPASAGPAEAGQDLAGPAEAGQDLAGPAEAGQDLAGPAVAGRDVDDEFVLLE